MANTLGNPGRDDEGAEKSHSVKQSASIFKCSNKVNERDYPKKTESTTSDILFSIEKINVNMFELLNHGNFLLYATETS